MAEAGAAALGEAPAYDHQNLVGFKHHGSYELSLVKVDLFPHLELEAILRAFRHLTPDAVAEYIIVNQATIPKKLRGEVRGYSFASSLTGLLSEASAREPSGEVSQRERRHHGAVSTDSIASSISWDESGRTTKTWTDRTTSWSA